jgi:hypothetical protein
VLKEVGVCEGPGVPGADRKTWHFTQLMLGSLRFFNAPSYLAASPQALLIPREVVKRDRLEMMDRRGGCKGQGAEGTRGHHWVGVSASLRQTTLVRAEHLPWRAAAVSRWVRERPNAPASQAAVLAPTATTAHHADHFQ